MKKKPRRSAVLVLEFSGDDHWLHAYKIGWNKMLSGYFRGLRLKPGEQIRVRIVEEV